LTMYFLLVAFFVAIYSAQTIECTVCQLVVSYTEKLIQKNESEQFIIKELDLLCAKLPGFGQECDNIVQQYAPQLIAWIIKKEPPQLFCAHVKLCTSQRIDQSGSAHGNHQMTVKQHHHKRDEQQTIPCSLCQIITKYVEDWVAENATEQVIIQRLDALCNILGALKPECQSFVATYAPKLITWIVKKEDPSVFCTQFGLCTGLSLNREARLRLREWFSVAHDMRHQKRDLQQGRCQICQLLLSYVEQLVVQNNTVSEIETKVDKLCEKAPSPINQMCETMVATYFPSLINWIVRQENPQAFCSTVSLC